VIEKIEHELFNLTTAEEDIAILRVGEPFGFNLEVAAISLAIPDQVNTGKRLNHCLQINLMFLSHVYFQELEL